MPADFDVRYETGAASCVVRVTGEVDALTAPQVREAIMGCLAACETGRALIADLEAVTFIDSTGLMVLLNTESELKRAGRGFAVACAAPQVVQLFSMTGFDEVLPLHPDVAAAQAAVGRTG